MAKTSKIYSPQEALARLQNLCSRSEKCVYDVKLKLQQWGVEPNESDKIIRSLQESNFLNEERYVRAYIKEKLNFAKWGRQKILRALKAKRVSPALISETLAELDDDKYQDDLLELLKKKNRSIKDESEYSRKAKLLRFALSRGYEYELAYELLSSSDFFSSTQK